MSLELQKTLVDAKRLGSTLKARTFYGGVVFSKIQSQQEESSIHRKMDFIRITKIPPQNRTTMNSTYQFEIQQSTKANIAKDESIYLRDLRSFTEPDADSRQVATFIIHSGAIVIHVGPLQAIIKGNEVLCFNIYHPLTVSLVSHWPAKVEKATVQNNHHALRCLEVVMLEVIHYLEWKFNQIIPGVSELLEKLSVTQTPDQLQTLLEAGIVLTDFHSEVRQLAEELSTILKSNEDMAGLYLSKERLDEDHEEAELLLEALEHTITEIDNRLKHYKNRLNLTEDFMKIHFDGQRNRLIRITLIVSIAALAVATGSLGAGMYGMNLINGLEEDPQGFERVSSNLLRAAGCTFAILFIYYRTTKYSQRTAARILRLQRDQSRRLYNHSDRSKLLYNFAATKIDDKQKYARFIRESQVDYIGKRFKYKE